MIKPFDSRCLFSALVTFTATVFSACASKPALAPAPDKGSAVKVESQFKSLKALGVKSLACRVTFPAMNYLAQQLLRDKKISKGEASILQEGGYAFIVATDGSSCFIQSRSRPKLENGPVQDVVEHFASVGSAALHGSCQMFQLGYVTSPWELSPTEAWVQEKDGTWKLLANQVEISPDFRKMSLKSGQDQLPVTVLYGDLDKFHLPVQVKGYLQGQGEMIYTVTYELSKEKIPVPLTTQLSVEQSDGKGPARMALEFHSCSIDMMDAANEKSRSK